jgi:hypothetical protein
MSDVVLLCSFIYFRYIFYVILTCPPVNDGSPKLVELVVINPNSKFGVHMSSFYVIFGS